MMCKSDMILQECVNIICSEGRLEDLIKISDFYHPEFPNYQAAFDWGLSFGEYLGKFRYGDLVFRFEASDRKTVLYFLGSRDKVRAKIDDIL
jgi:hypothetical protein